MSPVDLKLLKRLAKTCREAGIDTFEGYGMKFTLGDTPIKTPKTAQIATTTDDLPPGDSEELTDEQMLLWSTMDVMEGTK